MKLELYKINKIGEISMPTQYDVINCYIQSVDWGQDAFEYRKNGMYLYVENVKIFTEYMKKMQTTYDTAVRHISWIEKKKDNKSGNRNDHKRVQSI